MHSGKSIDSATTYFFWMSIVWRLSISEQFNFRLPQDFETHLQEKLFAYFSAKMANENEKIYELVKTSLFRYRLIDSPEYLNGIAGYFGGFFDYDHNILSFTMGDKILCVTFNEEHLPIDYSYLGFEVELNDAIINNGLDDESSIVVSKERFGEGIQKMIQDTAFKRFQNEKELADAIWQKMGLPGMCIPDEIFQNFMEHLYSEDSKQGDRRTKERYVEVFNETLQSFGYILY